MSTTPIVYLHTDAGAPQLSGLAGSLTALLDAILVNGYGVGAAAKPPAGWSLEFTALNKRAYRNDPVIGSGSYLSVDDSDTVSGGNARAAYVRAFEQMSSIGVGINGAPTVARMANGDTWAKSRLLTGVSRPWMAIATLKWLYLFMDNAGAGLDLAAAYFAGDIDSDVQGDSYGFVIANGLLGAPYSGSSGETAKLFYSRGRSANAVADGTGGYILRGVGGGPGAVPVVLTLPSTAPTTSTVSAFGREGGVYPSPVSGGLFLEEVYVREGAYLHRGRMPNCYCPQHPLAFADLEVIPSLSGLGGASVIAKQFTGTGTGVAGPSTGQLLFDITTSVA
ncbi:hypothetical protein PV767_04155 [Stenotrophomonas rhizophila]|uniref:hypothetical protein n=1 Tax=Stenotrophomonas TaxID=40323 RepID=UPI003B7C7DFF